MMKIIPKLAVCFKFDIYIFIDNTTFYKTTKLQKPTTNHTLILFTGG